MSYQYMLDLSYGSAGRGHGTFAAHKRLPPPFTSAAVTLAAATFVTQTQITQTPSVREFTSTDTRRRVHGKNNNSY